MTDEEAARQRERCGAQLAVSDAVMLSKTDLLDGTEVDEDDELFRIREELSRRNAGHSFYAAPIVDRWDPERRISGVSISPGQVAARKEYKTRGYAIASAAIDLVPEGGRRMPLIPYIYFKKRDSKPPLNIFTFLDGLNPTFFIASSSEVINQDCVPG